MEINQRILEEKNNKDNTTFAAGLEAFRKMENGT